jgi:NAD(P)-dependent dehydrogenase (short-subunit alcohol dehydrogenase family)
MKDRVALITGGGRGIGEAIARRFAAEGARLFLTSRTPKDLERVAIETGANFDLCDVTQPKEIGALVRKIGRVDILVNNAGIAESAPFLKTDLETWRRVMDTNVTSAFLFCKALVPGMIDRGYGRIVNIASISGKEGNPNASAYSAAKAGVIALTKSLGKELAGDNIAVNCITPAAAKTRIFEQMTPQHIDYMLSKIPRGRFVDVDEIASLAVWLASEENSFATGAVYDISGGRATY